MKRIYYYLLVSSVLLIVLAVVARTILIPGFIYFRDVTESTNVAKLYQRYIYTYSNDIGESLVEKARIPLFYLIFGTYKLLSFVGLGDEFYVKIKIFFLFIFSFLTFMLVARKLISKYLPPSENGSKYPPATVIPPILGALFYITNYWFTNRIAHFGLFFATVTIPIVFYLFFDYFFSERKSLTKLILLSLFLGVLTATPHTVLFEILIFVSIFIAYLVTRSKGKDNFLTLLLHLSVFLVITAVINLYWILPYAVSNSKPDAEVSETIVRLIGKYATLNNSVGLMGYWLTEPGSYTPSRKLDIVSYIPFLFLGVCLIALRIKRRDKLFLPLLILFSLGTFLATSETVTNTFYFKLMFDSPFKNFGWLFREYDKFGLVLTFVYAMAITLLFRFAINRRRILTMLVFPYASVIVLNLFFLNKMLELNYQPSYVPDSYQKVLNSIVQDSSEFNTLWYPGNPRPFWANAEEVRYTFSNLISPKPSITTRSEIINYASYLFNLENVYSINIGKALDLVGVKYLVVRKDDSIFKSGRTDDLLNTQTSIKKLFSDDLLTLYENTAFTGITKDYTAKITTNMGLNFLKQNVFDKYNNFDVFVDYTDRPSGLSGDINMPYLSSGGNLDTFLGNYEDRLIFPSQYSFKKEDGNPGNWKTGSLENVNHAEVDFFLNSLGLNIRQFDFGRGVVISRDGWQLNESDFKKGPDVGLVFSNHKNIKLQGRDLYYSSVPKDFDYYWNIIRSDEFAVTNNEALGVKLVSDISDKLIPHFKLTFYSVEKSILGIVTMYQDERGLMENIVKVPEGSQTAVFSIWTISKEPEQTYSYSLKELTMKNLTQTVKPINLTFQAESNCTGSCNLYVRALKSTLGGRVGVTINGNGFILETKNQDLFRNDLYEWVPTGKIDNVSNKVEVKLENIEGFNSINTLVLLSEEESPILYGETTTPLQLDQEKTILEITGNNNYIVETKQINPAKYEVKILQATDGKTVLGFAKPFSKNWILYPNNVEAKILNGYINGWEINGLKEGTYTIEYKPQRYFVIGGIVSGSTALFIIIYLATTYFRSVSASERKSNSQG